MDIGGPNSQGSGSQDSDEPAPPGSSKDDFPKITTPKLETKPSTPSPTFSTKPTAKGVANAKKRLRAFSIQKKSPLQAVPVPKIVTTGNTTVLIGKLSSNKVTPKPEKVDDEQKKTPKPPKPGGSRRNYIESYSDLQKRTLSEIEDMKRKMELVDLGIPLGLICPNTNEKAMPTKAMPPIKTFLGKDLRRVVAAKPRRVKCKKVKNIKKLSEKKDKSSQGYSAQVDEIIREAKKCRAEGREFKFDYQKFVPDYDNPFQRNKKDEWIQQQLAAHQQQEKAQQPQTPTQDKPEENVEVVEKKKDREREKDKKRSDKYDRKYGYRKDEKYREREEERSRDRGRSRDEEDKSRSRDRKDREDKYKKDVKEAKVDLNDYLVCDSWSLDERNSNSSPHVDEKLDIASIPMPQDIRKEHAERLKEIVSVNAMDSPKEKPVKIERLLPVIDSFEFEIDPNEEDEVLEIFDEETRLEKFSKPTKPPKNDSPLFDGKASKDKDDMNDDMFLESVLNEIKQENLSEDENEKGLVEYELSPERDNVDYSYSVGRGSVTPELDDRVLQSQRSDYSDTRSTNSGRGRRSSESGYRSQSSRRSSRHSGDKEFEVDLDDKMARSTVDSLETWSFVLKICQPLLFRHDRNRCFKETRCMPKLWYSINPKICSCVKDRAIVYDELEMCKTSLVDRVYQCDQFPEPPIPKVRNWYPPISYCLVETPNLSACDWEDLPETEIDINQAEDVKFDRPDSRSEGPDTRCDGPDSRSDVRNDRADSKGDRQEKKSKKNQRSSLTPERSEEVTLDIEYRRFMEAVCDVIEPKKETTRSTTPDKEEVKKKKKKNRDQEKKEDMEKKKEDAEKREGVEKKKKGEEGEKKKKKHESKSTEAWSHESVGDDEEKRQEIKRKKKIEADEAEKRAVAEAAKKRKMSTDNWSQESEVEQQEKTKKEKVKLKGKSRKRKHSTSTISSESDDSENVRKKRKALKKKALKDTKSKSAKRRKLGKKILKKLKEKKKKKVEKEEESTPEEEVKVGEGVEIVEGDDETKKKDKKLKKKKPVKLKKKADKKKKKAKSSSSSSSSSSSDSSSDSESESEKKIKKKKAEDVKKKKKTKKKKRQSSTDSSTSQSEELFDVNVLNNIKTERVLDDEPPRSHREIISVQQLQDDFSSNVKIKQEVEEIQPENESVLMNTFSVNDQTDTPVVTPPEVIEEAQPPKLDDTNHSQSSQDSVVSVKEPPYEKDDSHLRPSSQNSNYSFRDVIADQPDQYKSAESTQYKTTEEDKYPAFEESYEMYEHLAMAYQSDVASKQHALDATTDDGEQRIETVVRNRACGEIKCDWRRTDPPAQPTQNRPSRWGLKPGEVNIVLTGGNDNSTGEQYPIQSISEPVYKIQSLANRNDAAQPSCYDEAYMDMYGAMDRLQYGDCFATNQGHASNAAAKSANTVVPVRNTLDDRIDRALRETVLGEVAKDASADKDSSDKGILVTKLEASRSAKRVSFADGYKPGQDSDVEDPPVKKRKKPKRSGCAWPCPATHPDHVPLWDALPPPPPPPGSPPPPAARAPPFHLLRQNMPMQNTMDNVLTMASALPYPMQKFDPSAPIPNFMPPEPPPGLIKFT